MDELDREFLRFRDHGSADALARVFDALAPRLLLLAGHLTHDAAQAEDLVQTAFLQALRDARRYDGSRPVAAWLAGILRHRAIDERRRAAVRSAAPLSDALEGAPDPAELAGDAELYRRVVDAVLALEEPYRSVLNLRVVYGLAPTAIAHTLGRRPGTVRMQLKRGLEELRRAVPVQGLWLAFGDGAVGLPALRAAVLEAAADGAAATTPRSARPGASGAPAGLAPSLGGILTMKTMLGVLAATVLAVTLTWIARGWLRAESSAVAGLPRDRTVGAAAVEDAALVPAESGAVAGERALAAASHESPGGAAADALEVRVTFAVDGAAAPDVGVYLRGSEGAAPGVEERTDAAGRVAFAAPAPGSYEVHVDRVATPFELRWPRDGWLAVAIPPGPRVEGRVVDLAGAGVGGAAVFRRNERHHDLLQRVAVVGEAGAFALRDVEDGLELLARAPRHQPSGLETVRERDGAARIELRLGADGWAVRGRVLLPGGTPAPHAWVLAGVDEDAREEPAGSDRDPLASERRKPLDREGILLRADAEGRFATEEIPGGHVLLVARAAPEPPRAAPARSDAAPARSDAAPARSDTAPARSDAAPLVGWTTLRVAGDVRDELVVHLQPGAEIAGTVRDRHGAPVPGVTLAAEWEGTPELGQMEDDLGPFVSDRRAVADGNGRFRLAGLLPGDYDLRVYGEHEELLQEERVLGVAERAVWDPIVEPPCALEVRGRAPDGTPLAGWLVAAGDDPRRDVRHPRGTPTDADGRTRLRDLPPDRDLVVAAFPSPAGLPAAVRSGVRASRSVQELELRLAPQELPTASLRGRLVRSDGRPADGARVELSRAGWESTWTEGVDADGGFAFQGLAPGDLRARGATRELREGFDIGAFTLALDDARDLGDVVAPDAARVVVAVRAADGGEVGNLRVELVPRNAGGGPLVARWARDGRTYAADAPVGPALLRVHGGEFAHWCEPVHVPAGGASLEVVLVRVEPTLLRVVLPEGSSADGRTEHARLRAWDARGLCVVDTGYSASFGAGAPRILQLELRLLPGDYRVLLEPDGPGGPDRSDRVGAWGAERALRVSPSGCEIELDLR